jgi:predicted RNA-binding protein with RPS1 domain
VGYNTGINGFFKKQVEVFSNDPENGRIALNITGTVDANGKEVTGVKPLTESELKDAFKAREAELKKLAKEQKKAAKKAS